MRDKILLTIAVFGLIALVAEFAKGQTRIDPDQLKAPRVAVMMCSMPITPPGTANNGTPVSDCTGLYYIDVITPAGTELKIMGVPAAAPLDPTLWSIVP